MDGWDQLTAMALTVVLVIVFYFIYLAVKLIRKNEAKDTVLTKKERGKEQPVRLLTNAVIIVGLLLILMLAIAALFMSLFGC